MISREKILSTIRAIMSKTIASGCTEAEAMAALAKGRAMMDAYEVTAEDLLLKGESANVLTSEMRDPNGIRNFLGTSVADFCDCRVWRNVKNNPVFCGLQSDTDFAKWLLESLATFVQAELVKYLAVTAYAKGRRRIVINGFVLGACGRITQRLRELIAQSKAASSSNGRALVLAKSAMIDSKMVEMKLNFGKARKRSRQVSLAATAAGQAAGDRASFGRPVSSGGNLMLS